jgi:hypothetical protein
MFVLFDSVSRLGHPAKIATVAIFATEIMCFYVFMRWYAFRNKCDSPIGKMGFERWLPRMDSNHE